MAYCPSCGCRTAEAARFCPMCGFTINENAVRARMDTEEPTPRRAEVPQPNEQLVEGYATTSSCGTGTAKAMRVLVLLLVILLGLGCLAGGIIALTSGAAAAGILILVLGVIAVPLLWFVMHTGVVLFENVSAIARGIETQHRISAAQIELLSGISRLQEDSLRLNCQTVELLKVMDGDRFDAAKQAECQTAMLDRLVEQQQEHSRQLTEMKNSADSLVRLAQPHVQSFQSWKNETHRFAHAVALAISQLPDRLRSVLNGEQPGPSADEESPADMGQDLCQDTPDAPAGDEGNDAGQ